MVAEQVKHEAAMDEIVPIDNIATLIYHIRGQRVMLDRDLAELYAVETKALKQAVRRNIERFPEDFMFELTRQEFNNLRSQIVTSSWGGSRYLPMAFTEQGIAMLSSVLRSDRAIQVNIQIMRTFNQMRRILAESEELREKIEALEQKYDQQFEMVFEAIKEILFKDETPKMKIGFTAKEKKGEYGEAESSD